ncbi:VOC family protein [Paenibacillus montanisoli]|uniref:Glyoxalase/bleomycin resistance/dioxygenase family protein n=1 Tax=Paenibacillus montanisoli TaxID=2081970 RepID=A0A328U3X7_9BACL|nr:VOC family protein [Paenibacillus montanisoli]RAP77498.1 glyoxalase/bleomycin resistance/dioxygenase family protein [Paenibacillus montanisoli]
MKLKESGIILFTEDYETALAFYVSNMGLRIREQKANLTVLDFGGSYLMIEDQGVSSSAPKTRSQNPTVLRLDVYDFEDAVHELRGRDVDVGVYEFSWGTIAVIVDPEGNRIELKNAD